jgi:hypothetical protein
MKRQQGGSTEIDEIQRSIETPKKGEKPIVKRDTLTHRPNSFNS